MTEHKVDGSAKKTNVLGIQIEAWQVWHDMQAYLGHCNIQHTVRYTELSPTRFKNLWRD